MTRRFFAAKPLVQAVPGGSLSMGLKLFPTVTLPEIPPPVECPECPPPAPACVPVSVIPWTINGGQRLYHSEEGCITQAGNYGQLEFAVRGTWARGFRPVSLTVGGTLDTWLEASESSYIDIRDVLGNLLGTFLPYGKVSPYTIPLTFLGDDADHDLALISFWGVGGESFTLCDLILNCPPLP